MRQPNAFGEKLILNDLLLEVNNTQFQIDSMLLSKGVIHLLEIKNFEGDCYFDSQRFLSMNTGREFQNPLVQLQRSTSLLRQLLQTINKNYRIESSIVFVNPEFSLFQAPRNEPIILPTQVIRFLKELRHTPSPTSAEQQLAQNFLSLHQSKNRYTQVPDYSYEQLRKGIYCEKCRTFQMNLFHSTFICKNCGKTEKLEDTLMRNIKEYRLLFPDRKLTTQGIAHWCSENLSSRTIRRVLKRNFMASGVTSDTYYT